MTNRSMTAKAKRAWKAKCPACGTAYAFPGMGWERVWCDKCQTTTAESWEGAILHLDQPDAWPLCIKEGP